MAVAVGILSDTRRRTLEAIGDTFAPSLAAGAGDEGLGAVRRRTAAWPRGAGQGVGATLGRSGAALAVAAQIGGLLAQTMMPQDNDALGALLDAFADQDFANRGLAERTELVHAISESSPEAKLGVRQLRALTFLFF